MFSKPVATITTDNLQSLLNENAVENVRLEFKREIPNKNEVLKKLSSFANTFGGYLVIGVEEAGDGVVSAISGIDIENGFKQKIISWCFEGASPPLNAEVSEAIPSPQNDNKFCYVIYVAVSDLAPHFINGRKGCYIRTDEHSQRFEAKLAKQDELLAMLERRKKINERKQHILTRAQDRFETFTHAKYSESGGSETGIGARFSLSIVPRFPSMPIATQLEVLRSVERETILWGSVGFPVKSNVERNYITQNESALVLRPVSNFSIFEFNIWGLMFYATEIQKNNEIHLNRFLGLVCVFLRHAKALMERHKMMFPMSIELQFKGIRDVPWNHAGHNLPAVDRFSLLDDSFLIKLDVSSVDIRNHADRLAMNLLENVLFSMDWSEMVEVDSTRKRNS